MLMLILDSGRQRKKQSQSEIASVEGIHRQQEREGAHECEEARWRKNSDIQTHSVSRNEKLKQV